MATLYIIRGLPGSGKSTLAKKLVSKENHREADMFHMKHGKYDFKIENIQKAHNWCFNEIENLLQTSNEDCAVSNTFTEYWEYYPYIQLAKKYNYNISVIDCYAEFRNIHNVPEQILENMKNRWEPFQNCKRCSQCKKEISLFGAFKNKDNKFLCEICFKNFQNEALENIKNFLRENGIKKIGCRKTDIEIPVEFLSFQ